MEQFEEIYKNLKSFIERNFTCKQYNELELNFEKMNGLSNDIYLVKIYNKTTNEMLHEVIYRQFGAISDLVDRELETRIIDNLAENGLTPRIFETDGKTYRIEEFIKDSDTLIKDSLKEENVIERIIQILISYTMISGVYCYHVHSKSLSQDYNIEINPEVHNYNGPRISQNIFDKCMKDMLEKARKNLDKFSDKVKKNYKKFLNQEVLAKYEKIKYYVNNYNEIFSRIFPKKGFLVLNHNDVHRLNLLVTKNEEKLLILDHEYAALNLIGIDIVNYLIETNFDYTMKAHPYYQFEYQEIDFESYFEIFKNFLDKFELSHAFLLKNEESRNKFEKMKTFKYFLRLVCVISLFWLLYSVIYLDYENYTLQKTFDYFQHALDRLFIFEKAYKKLKTLNI